MELTERERRIAELLAEAGLDGKVARIVVFLSRVDRAMSKDIERAADLRQPEVSIAMKNLRERGWIREKMEKKSKGKGRPRKVYRLVKDLREMVAELVEGKREELARLRRDLEELEELVGLR